MALRSPSPKRSMSLEDIAAKAGVSRSTVSRVINNDGYVSERTRQRVMAIVDQVGFAPNPAARALVTRRTRIIGLVIPQAPIVLFDDAYYFPSLLQGISRVTSERDYALALWLGGAEEDEDRFYRQVICTRLVDGVILASAACDDCLIEHFLGTGTPFVLVERPGQYADRINFVTIDNIQASRQVIQHLIALGRRRIGLITGNLANTDAQDRLAGYRETLEEAGIGVDENLIAIGTFSYQSGYDGMRALIEQRVDAVFAANDITARGALQALHEAGLHVPGDVAIVGFDDLPTATQVMPPLTTVRQPIEDKGAQAATILLDLIEHGDSTPCHVMLPTALIVRESCGAAATFRPAP